MGEKILWYIYFTLFVNISVTKPSLGHYKGGCSPLGVAHRIGARTMRGGTRFAVDCGALYASPSISLCKLLSTYVLSSSCTLIQSIREVTLTKSSGIWCRDRR